MIVYTAKLDRTGLSSSVLILHLLLLLLPSPSRGETIFRDPVDFLQKQLLDVRAGPGYSAYENIRVHGKDITGTRSGLVPLYDARVGPVTFSNIFDQADFTRGTGARVGMLFTYSGDEYKAENLANRSKTLFAGGFLGYKVLTLYGYSDILGKKAGVIYAVRLAPTLLRFGKGNEFTLVLELQHMNRLYVDYYFGIRAWEATSVLTAYDGHASNNLSATFLYLWRLSKRLEFTFWAGETNYGVGVTNSPTVKLKHGYKTGVGFLFRFF